MMFDFHHASTHAPLVDLGIAQVRIHHAFGFFARAAGTPGARGRFGCAVVGNQCGHIRRKLITGEEGSTAIGAGLEFGQKHGSFCFAAPMAESATNNLRMRFCNRDTRRLAIASFLPPRSNNPSLFTQHVISPTDQPPCSADGRNKSWMELSLRKPHTIIGWRGEPRGWNRCRIMANSNSTVSITCNGAMK